MSLLTAAEKKPLRLIIRLHPTKMDLSSMTKLEDRHLTYILQRAPKLTSICLDRCRNLTEASLHFLLSCENLQNVSLWGIDTNEDFLQALRSKCAVFIGYSAIYINPPVPATGGMGGTGELGYQAYKGIPHMSWDEIFDTITEIPEYKPAADCHIYLWCQSNFLPQGLRLMELLRFRYITNFVWAKPCKKMGQYARNQHELLLFGTRGDARVPDKDHRPPTIINAPLEKTKTRYKPEAFYSVIETISPRENFPRPYLEVWDTQPAIRDNGLWTRWSPAP